MFDDLIEAASGGWGVVTALVVGGGLLAARGGRPLAKRAIRGYLTAADTVRSWTADVVEQAQDLYAESKAELAASTREAAETAGAKRAGPEA